MQTGMSSFEVTVLARDDNNFVNDVGNAMGQRACQWLDGVTR
jgi:hypothetical protein